MTGIIDYKAGNAGSVLNAFKEIGRPAVLVKTAGEIRRADKLILPGVGSAKATMDSLKEMGITEEMEDSVFNRKIPFLGICIGLQVLFEYSEEDDTECFGWLKGNVRRFRPGLRIPQIGWNEVVFKKDIPLTSSIGKREYFYFVNSYYAEPLDRDIILGETEYRDVFCSAIAKDNIFATQFHVEKSGPSGLALLKAFTGREDF